MPPQELETGSDLRHTPTVVCVLIGEGCDHKALLLVDLDLEQNEAHNGQSDELVAAGQQIVPMIIPRKPV